MYVYMCMYIYVCVCIYIPRELSFLSCYTDSRKLLVSNIGEMETVDIREISRPIRNIHDNDQVNKNGEELVSCEHLPIFALPRPLQAGYSVAEAVELLQRSGELVQLREE